MLLAFGVILLAVSFGIIISIYSMFFPFFENLKNISQYNSAYYAAIASVERGELVLRYKNPGFQGTGGFENTDGIGPVSDNNGDFGIVNSAGNGMRWTINSRTKSIPSAGGGNVDVMLADSDSPNYNMLNYSNTEIFNLGVDNTKNSSDYYKTGSNIKNFSGAYISGVFRLPPKVFQGFDAGLNSALLCGDSSVPNCDPNSDSLYDDAVVNRTLKGEYSGQVFSIIPTSAVNYNSSPAIVGFGYDSFIRESLFDDDKLAVFSTLLSDFSPVESNNGYFQSDHNVIGEYAGELKDFPLSDILRGTTGLSLKFSLMDLLRSRNANIYPFLEYKFDFSDYVSDRFYNIQGVGKVGDYNVRINVNKPTSNESAVGEFTIIF